MKLTIFPIPSCYQDLQDDILSSLKETTVFLKKVMVEARFGSGNAQNKIEGC